MLTLFPNNLPGRNLALSGAAPLLTKTINESSEVFAQLFALSLGPEIMKLDSDVLKSSLPASSEILP